ncbi:kinetoplastid kinetochore protein 5 [Trypanosoma equiperdum]|uniref:PH-like domain-containing protein n=2 Tax=Trypanozoon TaxID=39700 RepID=Q57XA1_TRYB2|nr:hypothetical protein, conserved [Trypanosoma brucei brucei TREU927]AAX69768.1 hypothetical protein, conserved [Trypanosoma brucei]AAZ12549.1 hypothetical protein, conserved [Trypanosoma brucei brucei TREU927]SCU72365.1 kinetoplastid kinetochore protein 5 [Trypanosoma equiperdum]
MVARLRQYEQRHKIPHQPVVREASSTSRVACGVATNNVSLFPSSASLSAKTSRSQSVKPSIHKIPSRSLSLVQSVSSKTSTRKEMASLTREAAEMLNPTHRLKGLASIDVPDELFHGVEFAPPPQCFRPAWSLIGTFKTDVHTLVSVDTYEGSVKWYQQSPKGGFHRMCASTSVITSVQMANAEGSPLGEYLVVINTSIRPSRITFGFKKSTDARKMVVLLTPPPHHA